MYHPALDPYHSAFRMLVLLAFDPTRQYDRVALQILDFYAIFPELVPTITFPKEHLKWKRQFSQLTNPYWFSGEQGLVFSRMQTLQDKALDLLYAQGLLDRENYANGKIQLNMEQFKGLDLPESALLQNKPLMQFLVTVLGRLPLHGVGGMKDRTHLLEYRYDNV
jgi:hypothetical protein